MKNSDQPIYPIPKDRDINALNKNGLTKREHACIQLGIPDTGDSELDEIIKKAERKKIAARAMQGILSTLGATKAITNCTAQVIAKESLIMADQLLKQLEQ